MKTGVLKRMLGYLTAYKLLLAGIFFSALLFVPLSLLGPVFIGRAIDAIVGPQNVDFESVAINLAWLAGTAALAAACQWFMQICTRKISAYVAQDMRREAFGRLHEVPLKVIDSHPHGDIASRLVNDADAIGEGFLQGLTQLFPGVITIVATIILMLMLNVPIAIMVILATPLSIIFARLVTRRTGKMFTLQSVAQGQVSGYVGEMVTNQNIVSVFGYEAAAKDEFETFNENYYKANFKATLYASLINPGARFVNALVYAAVAVFGALLALAGGITVGGISAFLAYANQYTKPFNEVTAVLTQLQGAVAGARRLFEVIDWQPEAPDAPDAADLQGCQGRVEAKAVDFSYSPTKPFIENLDFEARPGQRIALVGPTGCGKTTIINLLMRFFEVNAGEIQVDGMPIVAIKRNSLRGLYGMVLQDTWLKKGTVKENIAYANPKASDDEVLEAAKAAYAHGFIKRLPQGYNTEIESGGGNLSAGQKQLLCIARIMLAKPDMLILDEATSSIDTRTEMLIQKALEKLMRGHTSFIVAHRLSTIQNADAILVMDAGRIVERGTHEQLLAQNGFYAKLYNSQFNVE